MFTIIFKLIQEFMKSIQFPQQKVIKQMQNTIKFIKLINFIENNFIIFLFTKL